MASHEPQHAGMVLHFGSTCVVPGEFVKPFHHGSSHFNWDQHKLHQKQALTSTGFSNSLLRGNNGVAMNQHAEMVHFGSHGQGMIKKLLGQCTVWAMGGQVFISSVPQGTGPTLCWDTRWRISGRIPCPMPTPASNLTLVPSHPGLCSIRMGV